MEGGRRKQGRELRRMQDLQGVGAEASRDGAGARRGPEAGAGRRDGHRRGDGGGGGRRRRRPLRRGRGGARHALGIFRREVSAGAGESRIARWGLDLGVRASGAWIWTGGGRLDAPIWILFLCC